jgi:ABC-type uncharacterized transport system fused permease/ATPase subunit
MQLHKWLRKHVTFSKDKIYAPTNLLQNPNLVIKRNLENGTKFVTSVYINVQRISYSLYFRTSAFMTGVQYFFVHIILV